jgi:Flp pilus assembly protein TadG
MKLFRDRSGIAALEMALVAPVYATLLIAIVDVGGAVLCQSRIERALAGAAQYASIAGQANKLTATSIASNAQAYAAAVSSAFLGAATVTTVINNNAGTSATCCPGTTWTCSTSSSYTCSDGSSPGVYLAVTALYPFNTLFTTDTWLTGKTLTGTVVVRIQ